MQVFRRAGGSGDGFGDEKAQRAKLHFRRPSRCASGRRCASAASLRHHERGLQSGELRHQKDNTPRVEQSTRGVRDLPDTLESFAIPFAAGVADDDTGFMETAPAFIKGVQLVMPAIYYLRTTQGSRWSSVLKLFEIWDRSDRSPSNRIRPSGRAENGGGRQE